MESDYRCFSRHVTMSVKFSWNLMIVMIAALFQVALTGRASVGIGCNITDRIIYYNQSIQLTCHTDNNIENAMYSWTSIKFTQPQVTASITVVATNDLIQYTCTVSGTNAEDGYSSIYISATNDTICVSSGKAKAELVHGSSSSSNKTTLEGNMITFSCEFKGYFNFLLSWYGFKWIVTFQNGASITINKNSSHSGYYIYNHQTFRDCFCYYFTTTLYVHAIRSLSKARINCTADHEYPTSNPSSSYITAIIELPRLTIGPTNATGIKEHDCVTFECNFNASVIPYLAICEWYKDGIPTRNGNKYHSKHSDSEIICGFTIENVSCHDEGDYTCDIYYNESFGGQFDFPKNEKIKSELGRAVLKLETNSCDDEAIIIVILVFAALCVIAVFVIFLICWYKCGDWYVCNRIPVTSGGYSAISETTQVRSPESVWFIEQPKAENVVFTGNVLELSCRAEAESGMTVEYCWFKCLERDYSRRASTEHSSYKMIIRECSDDNEGYYFCEVTAYEQNDRVIRIKSSVTHVKVVDTDIYFTIQPPCEVIVRLGEKLTLECRAISRFHLVEYQWHKGRDLQNGATQSMLTIPSMSEENFGPYYCIVKSGGYSVISETTQVRNDADLSNLSGDHSLIEDNPDQPAFKSICADVLQKVIDNYEDLIELNATAMLASLFSKRVITLIEKDIILQTKPLEREKMQYLLDKIIIPSLQAGVVQKFELFLEVMKGSEDIAINILAQKLDDAKPSNSDHSLIVDNPDQPAFKRPAMRLLHEIVVPRIAADWSIVADYLEYKVEYKRIIKKRGQNNPVKCCVELLEDWLSSDRGVSPKSWSRLIKALKGIKNLEATTKKIVQELVEAGVDITK